MLDRDPIWARVTSPAFDWTVAVFVKRGPGLDWGRAGDRLGSGRGSMERKPGLSGALVGVPLGQSHGLFGPGGVESVGMLIYMLI